jgi:hypothetical protein
MATKRQREIALTAAAIVVLAGAVLAYRLHTIAPEPAAVSSQPSAAPAANATPTASKAPGLTELNLPALSARRGELQEAVRDPFRFKPKPPPPPPAVLAPMVTQPTGPVEPPPPPRIALKFCGTLDSKESTKGPLACLSDSRGVYHGHVGDTIEGRYRILGIGVESIDLAYLDGRGRQTIRLSGQ